MNKTNPESLGWISVKKRLPKHAWVQVLITNGKYVCVSRARILVAHPDVATHWMPLARTKAQPQESHIDHDAILKALGDRISDEMIMNAADMDLLLMD